MKNKIHILLLLIILALGAYFRIYNLGYSDFQGDEVSAQNYLFDERGFWEFLLSRTIGPGQYVVSKAMNNMFLHSQRPEMYQRAPFAFAGVITILAIYLATIRLGNKKIALVSTGFVALSGLLIAFSRITQYQSFVMFFAISAIYCAYRYLSSNNTSYLIGLSIISAVSLLFHYDSLSFILPIVLLLITKRRVKGTLTYGVIGVAITSIFYIPFIQAPGIRRTFNYLMKERIASTFTFDSIFYSVKLLSLYHSKELLILMGLGLIILFVNFFKKGSIVEKFIIGNLAVLILLRFINQQTNTLLTYLSAILIGVYILLTLKESAKSTQISAYTLIKVWFLVSLGTYGLFVIMPLTHIYNFLIPFFVLIAWELNHLLEKRKIATLSILLVIFISTISFNYESFLDTDPEYPWDHKKYIFGKMPTLIADNNKVKGVFGFPYHRNWREIRFSIDQMDTLTSYVSNEKYRLAKYYMKPHKWDETIPRYYVHVDNPQSLANAPMPENATLVSAGDGYEIYEMDWSSLNQ